MNCLCNLFDDSTLWLIIIAILLVSLLCNGCGHCGGYNTNNSGCGCGCGCGCG